MAYKNYKYRLTILMYGLIEDQEGFPHISENPIEKPIVIENPFNISFTVNSTPINGISNASINIFNLNESTRNAVFYDYRRIDKIPTIYLEAGYEGGKFDLIFAGHATVINSQRQGVDVVTHIEAMSGVLVADASTSMTIKEGATEEDVVNSLMESGLGVSKTTKMTFKNYAFIRPVALWGNNLELLRKYTNGNAFIDLNRYYVIDDNGVISQKAKVIDDKSGLLKTPKRNEITVVFDIMFAPELHPADLVEVRSEIEKTFSGLYKVYSVKHSGNISDGTSSRVTTQVEVFVGAQATGAYRYD